jgi:magnesium chelatase family protein
VPAVPYKELSSDYQGEPSEAIRLRIVKARQTQVDRFQKDRIYTNSKMKTRHIRKHCLLKPEAQELLDRAMSVLGLSARAFTRILKVSRTIADIEGEENIQPHHVSEAIQYRTLDRAAY